MGIFATLRGAPSEGAQAYVQPQPTHQNPMQTIGTLADLFLTGGVFHALNQRAINQQAMQQQLQDRDQLASLFRPETVTESPQTPVADPSGSGMASQLTARGPFPAQTQMFGGPSITRQPAQMPTFEQAAPAMARAAAHGVDITPFASLIQNSEPDLQFVNGMAVNKKDPANIGRRFGANLSNVNNTLIDTQDPGNANRTIPQVDKGQEVVYDAAGKPAGVRNLPGAAQAAGEQAGAVAGAQEGVKAGLDIIGLQMPDGSVHQMPRSVAAYLLGGQGAGLAPKGLGTSQTPGDQSYTQDTGKAQAKSYQDVLDAGNNAPAKIAKLQQIDRLLGDFEGGKFGGTKVGFASALNSLGVKIDPKLGNEQAAQALSSQMALELRDPSSGGGMPGSMSNSDREFLTRMAPGLSQSAQGRRQLVQMGVAVQQRNADVAQKARAWTKGNGRLDKPDKNGMDFYDYLGQWSAAQPLFGK
jgi:hypothetical protein